MKYLYVLAIVYFTGCVDHGASAHACKGKTIKEASPKTQGHTPLDNNYNARFEYLIRSTYPLLVKDYPKANIMLINVSSQKRRITVRDHDYFTISSNEYTVYKYYSHKGRSLKKTDIRIPRDTPTGKPVLYYYYESDRLNVKSWASFSKERENIIKRIISLYHAHPWKVISDHNDERYVIYRDKLVAGLKPPKGWIQSTQESFNSDEGSLKEIEHVP